MVNRDMHFAKSDLPLDTIYIERLNWQIGLLQSPVGWYYLNYTIE